MSLEVGAMCPCCKRCLGGSENYTHNVSKLWRDTGCYEALYQSTGKPVSEVLPIIRASLDTIRSWPSERLAEYDAPNGWGSGSGALEFLMRVAHSLEETVIKNPAALMECSP